MRVHRFRRVVLMVLVGLLAAPVVSSASPTLDAAVACRKAVTKRGKSYANTRRKLLLKCIDKLLKCDLPGEIEGVSPASCRSTAKDSCTARVGPALDSSLNTAKNRFRERAALACLPFTVSSMCSTAAGGLWFGNDPACGTTNIATCGAMADLATLLDCLRDEIDPEIDSVVGRVKPRGGLLLDNVGLGADFPDLPRPPTVTKTITASGGPLDALGTISPGAGEGIKFDADANVSCGGGMNGKVTISIGSGTNCGDIAPVQQYVIKEDYGPTRTATFGPFASDQIYCIERKDGGGMGGCMDSITGTVDVP